MRITALVIGLLLGSITSYAQFTESDSLHFVTATKKFQTWLLSTPSDTSFKVQGFECNNEKVTLKLTTKSRADWLYLRTAYYKYCKRHVGVELLKRMAFDFETPLDSIAILIVATDETYKTNLHYANNTIQDSEVLPLGIEIKGSGGGDYPISEMTAFSSPPVILKNKSEKDIEDLKTRIMQHLEGHYESKEQFWGREAQVDILEIDNEFTIEVTNISKEVLNDFAIGYFELIIIDIFIHQNGSDIEIVYNFRAKYGSGIILPPRRSGYYDMTEEYPEYLDRYDKIVRQMIYDVATATPVKN